MPQDNDVEKSARRALCAAFPYALLGQADNPRRLVVHHDDSVVRSCAYRNTTLLGGMRWWIQRDRLSRPLHNVDGQSRPWGVCIILASRREESHLYSLQEDLMGSPPHPWLRGHFEGTDRSDSLNVGYKEQISNSLCYGATSGHNPRACGAVGERTGYA